MRRAAAALCAAALVLAPFAARAEPSPEYLIKAAYLYNFAMFIEWPPDAFSTRTSPFVIGILGADRFDRALERTVAGKRIDRRPIVVRRVDTPQELRRCHIVFVSSSDASRSADVLGRLDGLPILVVGETADFARRGGSLAFLIEENRVRFEVNLDAARRAKLTISAKLLTLAKTVRTG
jgi:hypothetical protein